MSGFFRALSKIVKFLSFAIDKSINIKDVKVTDNDIFNKLNDKKYPIEIEVYRSMMHFFKDEPKIKFYTMLFQYTDIQDNFKEKINNWIEAYSIMKPALNLFFSARYNPSQYVESEFLSLTQVLETYHRESYGTKKSFKDRITEIITPFNKYIGSDSEVEKLIENIKITRNYYTHYEDKLLSNGATPCNDLPSLSRKIEGILQLVFLTKIGFTKLEIENIFNGNNDLENKITLMTKDNLA